MCVVRTVLYVTKSNWILTGRVVSNFIIQALQNKNLTVELNSLGTMCYGIFYNSYLALDSRPGHSCMSGELFIAVSVFKEF